MERILLSVPHLTQEERTFVDNAFRSNWISTVGPDIQAFESEFEDAIGLPALALSSGTAAIHLGLRLLGISPGDQVFCQDLTFVASANPIRYLGAEPIFIDSNYETWNMDPELLASVLKDRAAANSLPKAVIVVDLFGRCADMERICEVCGRYEIPILEDAAEALGGRYKNAAAGSFGAVGAFSFNGNKIITTSGGGMLVAQREEWIAKARFWATQARNPGIYYDHSDLGYNYRLSNVLAALGRGQLRALERRVLERRSIAFRYRDAFSDIEGLSLMPQLIDGIHTNWLSVFLLDEQRFGSSRDALMQSLDAANIESRPVWKPMHLQPLFAKSEHFGGEVSEDLFRRGICLPSSSSLTIDQQLYVVNHVRRIAGVTPLPELAVNPLAA